MTGTTLNSTVLDRNPVVNAVVNTKKVTGKTQDFGDVLGKTAQKLEQSGSTKASVQQSDKKAVTEPKDAEPAREDAAADYAETMAEEETTQVRDVTQTEKSTTEISEAEEPVDEMTIDEIANALEQIIEQIKQILDITDEELLSGMEDLNMKPLDLMNSDNMAQLVTAVSGEDSVISLVADEELYTALQDITEMVDAKVNDLLENTGLTSEELDAVLQKLQELESQKLEEQMGDAEIVPSDSQEDPDMEQADAGQIPKQPVVIKEDNTQSAKKYDSLPENQQENPMETLTDNRTRNTGRDTRDNDNKESKNFGQNNASQNLQNNVNEAGSTVAEGVEKFTSESTENILRQLADMVKIVKNENLTEMELQLHPASLGTVNVSLTTKGGVVTAQFTTQNEAVKAAIEAQASQLQTNLEEQGVKIEAIEVSVASHEMERNLDKEGSGQQQSEEQRAERIQGTRRRSINLRALGEDGELEQEMSGADDATRIAMEMMAANGNTMDLLA
ncbi:MAG: flagellar hook-length control protein FliK [Lachnospiraceae bacterium]|nr:flagellar hook-length control protein FliK [Lachnospiraceae bacterium]